MSFCKEPSFIGGVKDISILGDLNFDDIKGSQNSFGPLLNSKILLDTSKNFDLSSKQTPPVTGNRKSLSDDNTYTDNIFLQTNRLSSELVREEEEETLEKKVEFVEV